jgi:hypothetical protein
MLTPETILASAFGILDIFLLFYQWKERSRIKAKEEIWNRDIQSLVNIVARVDKNEIQDVKELKQAIRDIGSYANGIHVTLKDELKIKD